MTTGYRSIMRLDESNDAIVVAERHLRDWLRRKASGKRSRIEHLDWEGLGEHVLGEGVALRVVASDDSREPVTRRLYQLREKNSQGTYVVSLYAVSRLSARDHQQSLMVETAREGAHAGEALRHIAPPGIVRDILDTEHATDGALALYGAPEVIRRGHADRVVDAVKDPDRTASVVVAASPGPGSDEQWRDVVETLTRESVGVTSKYVVYDDALEEVQQALPDSHTITPGQIRTFVPGVDVSQEEDGRRHRILGPHTLLRSLEEKNGKFLVAKPLQKRHAEVARRRFVERDLPTDLERSVQLLRREELADERRHRVHQRLAESAIRTESLPAVDISESRLDSSYAADDAVDFKWRLFGRQLVSRWLGQTSAGPDALKKLDELIDEQQSTVVVAEEQLQEAATREEELGQRISSLQSQLEDLELEIAETEEDRSQISHEVTELRRRLVEAGQHDTFVPPVEDLWKNPENVEELVARISDDDQIGENSHPVTEFIEFTGDVKKAAEIDTRDDLGRFASALWDYVKVLYDYATLKQRDGFSGGVHKYLTDDHASGHKCSPRRHAANESDSVDNHSKWRAQRVFRVPSLVDPSGNVYMSAHFKPNRTKSVAPRMYYYDDLDDSGKIYIGYIGMHLSNTQTN